MQKLKHLFSQLDYQDTFFNIQKCLRLNDVDEIGDSTHYLTFHMLGMFSFRKLSVPVTIQFWLDFLKEFGLYPHYVTIHPDKMEEWSKFYPPEMEIRPDTGCLWSDGNIGGYCTEFYYNDIEIGNIVNPLGTCIDVGFGLERLLNLKYGQKILTKDDILKETIEQLIQEGVVPGNSKQGYILRKLLVMFVFTQGVLEHDYYWDIYKGQIKLYKNYLEMKGKKRYQDKTREWWKDTIGIDVDNIEQYNYLLSKHPTK
jgi:alanyl-tRNA synthetase